MDGEPLDPPVLLGNVSAMPSTVQDMCGSPTFVPSVSPSLLQKETYTTIAPLTSPTSFALEFIFGDKVAFIAASTLVSSPMSNPVQQQISSYALRETMHGVISPLATGLLLLRSWLQLPHPSRMHLMF